MRRNKSTLAELVLIVAADQRRGRELAANVGQESNGRLRRIELPHIAGDGETNVQEALGSIGDEVPAPYTRFLISLAAVYQGTLEAILPPLEAGVGVVAYFPWGELRVQASDSGLSFKDIQVHMKALLQVLRKLPKVRVLAAMPSPGAANLGGDSISACIEGLPEWLQFSLVSSADDLKKTLAKPSRLSKYADESSQLALPFTALQVRGFKPTSPQVILSRITPARPTEVYDTYWRFAAERQEVFFRRAAGEPGPWTKDPILQKHKFTNAYRASDRVSQFLIRNVIYTGDQSPEEVFFRTLIFKMFNKVETWELLEREFGEISIRNYNFDAYDRALTAAMGRGEKIYSAAYIVPSVTIFGHAKKHRNHLLLLEKMMRDGMPSKVHNSRSLRQVFEMLLNYPGFGKFLAFQYTIDLNYSEIIDFSEMDFVVPGPGALDGIAKCFSSLGGLTETDIIKLVAERQSIEFERLGIPFRSLWGRPLQLIDCQNLFCEVDKYARVAHPEVGGLSGRTRIKQIFRPQGSKLDFWFPPKWCINEQIASEKQLLGKRTDHVDD